MVLCYLSLVCLILSIFPSPLCTVVFHAIFSLTTMHHCFSHSLICSPKGERDLSTDPTSPLPPSQGRTLSIHRPYEPSPSLPRSNAIYPQTLRALSLPPKGERYLSTDPTNSLPPSQGRTLSIHRPYELSPSFPRVNAIYPATQRFSVHSTMCPLYHYLASWPISPKY